MKFLLLTLVGLFAWTLTGGETIAQKNDEAHSGAVDSQEPFLGIQFTNKDQDKGVGVTGVIKGSPAEKSGLKIGDVILEAGGSEIGGPEQFGKMIGEKKIGDSIGFVVKRGDKKMELTVVIGDRKKFDPTRATSGLKVEKPKQETFKSADGLDVTVDIYAPYGSTAPTILLCHQAGWSRGEYLEIAPKLNEMGFNCFAMDQRSGGSVNEVVNATNKAAVKAGKDVGFLAAEQDIVAALKNIESINGQDGGKTILWGSSYSAALSLRIAGEHPELVDGVLAFAPGEYFVRFGKPKDWVASSAKKIKVPAFITSAKNELKNWKSIFDAIPGESGKSKTMFVPKTKGNHGSRALWEEFGDNAAYWNSTNSFLSQFLNK